MNRWTRKECSRCINELKSPFEGEKPKPNGMGQQQMNIAAAIKQHLLKNRVAQ